MFLDKRYKRFCDPLGFSLRYASRQVHRHAQHVRRGSYQYSSRPAVKNARVLLQRGPLYQIAIAAVIPSTQDFPFTLGNSRPALISISGKSSNIDAAALPRWRRLSKREIHQIDINFLTRHATLHDGRWSGAPSGISCSQFLLLILSARHRIHETDILCPFYGYPPTLSAPAYVLRPIGSLLQPILHYASLCYFSIVLL